MHNGWIYEPVVPGYETLLFYNALQIHQDCYYYTPIAMAKREEQGIKYRFLCIAIPKNKPYSASHFTDIQIYKSPKGMPYVIGLYKVDFDKAFPNRTPLI